MSTWFGGDILRFALVRIIIAKLEIFTMTVNCKIRKTRHKSRRGRFGYHIVVVDVNKAGALVAGHGLVSRRWAPRFFLY